MVGGEGDGIAVDAALEGTSSSPASEGASEGASANCERAIEWGALGEAVAVDLALAALRPLRFGSAPTSSGERARS